MRNKLISLPNEAKILFIYWVTTIFDKDLSVVEEDNFFYDYATTLDNVPGQVDKYVFTITNRDGLTNQVSLSVTIQ